MDHLLYGIGAERLLLSTVAEGIVQVPHKMGKGGGILTAKENSLCVKSRSF